MCTQGRWAGAFQSEQGVGLNAGRRQGVLSQRADVRSGTTQVGPFTHQTMCEGREGGMGLGHRHRCKMLHAGCPLVYL